MCGQSSLVASIDAREAAAVMPVLGEPEAHLFCVRLERSTTLNYQVLFFKYSSEDFFVFLREKGRGERIESEALM